MLVSKTDFALSRPIAPTTELILAENKRRRQKVKATIVEEDTYVATVEHIIQRDFFPALVPLQETLNPSMRRSAVRSSVKQTGSFEEDSPEHPIGVPRAKKVPGEGGGAGDGDGEGEGEGEEEWGNTPTVSGDGDHSHPPPSDKGSMGPPAAKRRNKNDKHEQPKSNLPKDLTLDKYMASYTSEDNASFDGIIEEERKSRESKVFWLEEHAKQAAQHIVNRASNTENRTGMIDTWTYSVHNSLMYFPQSDDVVQEVDKANVLPGAPKVIVHENTRFPGGFFGKPADKDKDKNKDMLSAPPGTPGVGGYKFMRTPSPSPSGNGESPFITWGDIIGTPLHLEEEDHLENNLPKNKAQFRVQATSSREALLHKLDDEIMKRGREKTRLTSTARRHTATPSTIARLHTPITPTLHTQRSATPLLNPITSTTTNPLKINASPSIRVNLSSPSPSLLRRNSASGSRHLPSPSPSRILPKPSGKKG